MDSLKRLIEFVKDMAAGLVIAATIMAASVFFTYLVYDIGSRLLATSLRDFGVFVLWTLLGALAGIAIIVTVAWAFARKGPTLWKAVWPWWIG